MNSLYVAIGGILISLGVFLFAIWMVFLDMESIPVLAGAIALDLGGTALIILGVKMGSSDGQTEGD